jgi:hypothetical protein
MGLPSEAFWPGNETLPRADDRTRKPAEPVSTSTWSTVAQVLVLGAHTVTVV